MRRPVRFSITNLFFVVAFVAATCAIIPKLPLYFDYRHGAIYCVDYSPDGKSLASGGQDGRIRIWDFRSKGYHDLDGHRNIVSSLAFSNDGKSLLSGSRDAKLLMWDLNKRSHRRIGGTQWIVGSTVAFSPDSKSFAVADEISHAFFVYDLQGNLLACFPQQRHVLAYVGSNKLLTQQNDRLVAWDLQTKTRLWETTVGNRINCLAVSPDLKLVAAATNSKGTLIIDSKTGEIQNQLRSGTERLSSVAFSPDGNSLVTSSVTAEIFHVHYPMNTRFYSKQNETEFSGVRLWNLNTGQLQASQKTNDTCWSVSFSPDGKSIAVGRDDWRVQILDAKNLAVQQELRTNQKPTLFVWVVFLGMLGYWLTNGYLMRKRKKKEGSA